MDSFELNKIAGAILGTCLFVMGAGFLAEGIYHPPEVADLGFALPEPGHSPEPQEVVQQGTPLGALLAVASAEDGAAGARICAACHSLEQGGGNRLGPPLYDIVGREVAAAADFSYSPILEQLEAEGKHWTYAELDAFLAAPRDYAPGTRMTFAGVASPEDRANLLAYLATLSASPVPFPPAPPAQGGAAQGPVGSPLGTHLAAASAENGLEAGRICAACHNFAQGEPNKIGPVLYNIVGQTIASAEGFTYSDALQAMHAEGKVWTYEALDAFLAAPRDYAPGTRMTFAGVADPQARADIIALLTSHTPNPPPYPLPEGTSPGPGAGEVVAAVEPPAPVMGFLATASAEDGQADARICGACHSFGAGEGNKIGPALHNSVGNTIGSAEGFNYSDVFKAMHAEGKVWTYAELDAFLAAPRDYAPGTRMTFAGVSDPQQRANIIAFLASESEHAPPLPTP